MTTKNAAQYKKGDQVRILIGEGDKAYYGMSPAMRKVKGQVGTITHVPRPPSSALKVRHPAFGETKTYNYAAHELEPYKVPYWMELGSAIMADAPAGATHYHPDLPHKYLSTAGGKYGSFYHTLDRRWVAYNQPTPEHFDGAYPLFLSGAPKKAASVQPPEPIAPDLAFLAEEVTEWPEGAEDVALDNDGEVRFYPGTREDYYPEGRALSRAITAARHRLARRIFSYDTWLQARSRLPQALPEGSTSPADKPEAARVDYPLPGVQSRDELVKENASLAKQIASLRDRLDRKLSFVVENDKKIAAWDILLKD